MEKSIFKIEDVPVPFEKQGDYTLKVFNDSEDLHEKFADIENGDNESILYMQKWAERIGNKKSIHSFDTLLQTLFDTKNNFLKVYFDINQEDEDYLKDLKNSNSSQHAKLAELYLKTQDKFKSLILKSITDKDIRETLIDLIEEYNLLLENRVDTFFEKSEEYREDFYSRVSKRLGSEYDLEKIKNLVHNTVVKFTDPLGSSGSSNVQSDHEVTINLTFGPFYTEDKDLNDIHSEVWDHRDNYAEEAKRTFFHELLHIITSNRKQIVVHNKDSKSVFSIQNTGVSFVGNKIRFTWLNEALTEIINLDLRDETEICSYLNEIMLYELISKKIPDREAWIDLQQTYFFNARKDIGLGLEEWKENRKRIDESLGSNGKNFLVKLDNWIEANGGMPDGVKKAHEIISQWEDGKPRPEDFYLKTL